MYCQKSIRSISRAICECRKKRVTNKNVTLNNALQFTADIFYHIPRSGSLDCRHKNDTYNYIYERALREANQIVSFSFEQLLISNMYICTFVQGVWQVYKNLIPIAKRLQTFYTEYMSLPALKKASIPPSPNFVKLLGPSFILLGLGLGSGELILWPYLTSQYGLGIIWGAVIGITLQFFINMEISRYTLATGESVFVGLTRKLGKLSPVWFIFSTLLPWMWPGIIASSATLLASLFGISYTPLIPVLMLVAIGIIYTLGPVIYKTQERLEKLIIGVGVPFVFALAVFLAKPADWQSLGAGLIGIGNGFWLVPAGISATTFLAAFAYAGAGGNLNLGQSLYIKEKGYGMGKYSGHLTSFLTGKQENISLTGTTFENNPQNIHLFNAWWRKINLEHAIVFWITGAVTMLLLALLSYVTVFGSANQSGIMFVVEEAQAMSIQVGPIIGVLFLSIASVMLFFTQFSVFGTTSRIMTENLLLTSTQFKTKYSGGYFYFFLWLQIALGVLVFLLGFKEPLTLVVIGAVLNAFSMFVYSGLILWLNKTSLYKQIQPNLLRTTMVTLAFLFYGGFSIYTILSKIL